MPPNRHSPVLYDHVAQYKVAPEPTRSRLAIVHRSRQPGRKRWRLCLSAAVAALLLRLALVPFLYQENLNPEFDHWMFGHEQGKVARSIALGQGFANPLLIPTGATAYPAPVYPFLMATVFKLLGIYSRASAIFLIVLNCLFSAIVIIPLFYSARYSFGERTAVVASWIWVIFPYAVYGPIARIWDTWLTTLVLTVLFALTLKLARSDNLAAWAGFGQLWGFAALLNPVVLSVLPGLWLWAGFSLRHHKKRFLLPAVVGTLCVLSVAAPWMVRNYLVFQQFIPIRDSIGLELYVGNDGNATHEYDEHAGPWTNPGELEHFRDVGEIRYFKEKGTIAVDLIRSQPAGYVVMTLRRLANIWTDFWSLEPQYLTKDPYSPLVAVLCTLLSVVTLGGLWRAWRVNAFEAWPYLIVLLFYPAAYYFTHTADWYRRPIDPLFVILAAYAVVSFISRVRPSVAE